MEKGMTFQRKLFFRKKNCVGISENCSNRAVLDLAKDIRAKSKRLLSYVNKRAKLEGLGLSSARCMFTLKIIWV